ncbi:hypothetical protein FG379_002023 [Cryptosporidium bovis]|uniref:uncharacterized protein n=1 Tax=Cryptosporidium bovis TaxID=310047 RepID=UPI00351A7888|nr:hypothetical protein FG379_002023 [Cryptosporidium bovis]
MVCKSKVPSNSSKCVKAVKTVKSKITKKSPAKNPSKSCNNKSKVVGSGMKKVIKKEITKNTKSEQTKKTRLCKASTSGKMEVKKLSNTNKGVTKTKVEKPRVVKAKSNLGKKVIKVAKVKQNKSETKTAKTLKTVNKKIIKKTATKSHVKKEQKTKVPSKLTKKQTANTKSRKPMSILVKTSKGTASKSSR